MPCSPSARLLVELVDENAGQDGLVLAGAGHADRDCDRLCDSLVGRKRLLPAMGALRFLADRPDFGIALKDGFAIGPRKRGSGLAGAADYRALGRLSRK